MSVPFLLSYAVLWALVIFQSLVLLGLVRTGYRLQRTGAPPGHLRGREAPEFTAVDVSGEEVASVDFAGRLRAFLFVSPDCPTCTVTLEEMEALKWKTEGSVVVVCRGEPEGCRRLAETHEVSVPVLVDEELRVSELFLISSVPTAVLIDSENRIQSIGEPMRGEELEQMLQAQAEPAMDEVH